jgi:hypothetical protein
MKCERCDGLMLEGDFIDMEESGEGLWLRAWRCLNCGHATDSVMAVNRQLLNTAALPPRVHTDVMHDAEPAEHPTTLLAV